MNINLHIERLVLDGLSLGPSEGAKFQSALEGELGRLLAGAGEMRWNSGALASVATPPVQLAPGGSPAAWGRQTAAALLHSLPAQAAAATAVKSAVQADFPFHSNGNNKR